MYFCVKLIIEKTKLKIVIMKKVLFVSLILLMGVTLNAQHVFNKGSLLFNVGIGGLSSAGWIPSVFVSGEYGVIPTGEVGLVSFGGIIAYKYSTYTTAWVNTNYNYSQIVIGPRAIWHVHAFTSDKYDAYAGVGGGVRLWSQYQWDPALNDVVNTAKVSPYGEIFVGGRMMFKEKFGILAEIGYGTLSTIKFGVTFGF